MDKVIVLKRKVIVLSVKSLYSSQLNLPYTVLTGDGCKNWLYYLDIIFFSNICENRRREIKRGKRWNWVESGRQLLPRLASTPARAAPRWRGSPVLTSFHNSFNSFEERRMFLNSYVLTVNKVFIVKNIIFFFAHKVLTLWRFFIIRWKNKWICLSFCWCRHFVILKFTGCSLDWRCCFSIPDLCIY